MLDSFLMTWMLTLSASDQSDCEDRMRNIAALKSYYSDQAVNDDRGSGNYEVGQFLRAYLLKYPQETLEVLRTVKEKKRLWDVLRGLGATLIWKEIVESRSLPDDLIYEVLKEGIVFNIYRIDRTSVEDLNFFYETEIDSNKVGLFMGLAPMNVEKEAQDIALYMRGTAMFQAIKFAEMGKSHFKLKRDRVRERYFQSWLAWLKRRDAYIQLELELHDMDLIDTTLQSFLESESHTQR